MMRADPNDDAPDDEVIVVVRVERTGGIAGLRREWTAEPPPDEAPRWIGLIEGCPWDAADDSATTGADRYQWRIVARLADEPPRRAELPDDRLQGPWRELVDQVRAFGRPERPRPPGRGGGAPAHSDAPGVGEPARGEGLTS